MARSIFLFNTHDLPHRAGEMREYELDLKITEAVGVDWPIDENFTELYYYETASSKTSSKRGAKGKSGKEAEIDLDEDDLSFLDGDDIDLEPAIRDAIILNLAVNPLCTEDCPGLEDKKGENWAYLSQAQPQTPTDQRWSALKDFPLKN